MARIKCVSVCWSGKLDFFCRGMPQGKELLRWRSPRADRSSPLRSPAMAGGLFTMDREFFYHLGTYDEGMEFWGAENVEMSLRVIITSVTVVPTTVELG